MVLVANKRGRPMTLPAKAESDATKSYGGDFGNAFGLLAASMGMAGRNQDLTPTKSGAAAAYQLIPSVNRAINLRAEAVESLDWKLVQRKPKAKPGAKGSDVTLDESEASVPQTPFGVAIREVQRTTGLSLINEIVLAHDLYGEVYVEPLGNRYRTTGLKWLNPLGMIVEVVNGEIQDFRWSPMNNSSRTFTFDPDAIAYKHMQNPFDDFRGQGLVEVTMDSLNVTRNVMRWLMSFFRNSARPGVIVSPKPSMEFTNEQQRIIATEIQMFMKGSDNAYSTLVPPIPMDVTPFEQPNIAQFYSIVDPLEVKIYTTFGVPVAMAGDSGRTRFKQGSDILQAFYINTVIPLARWVQDYFNFQILPFFDMDEDVSFEFDLSEFDTTSQDDKLRVDIAVEAFEATIWTRDQALVYVGDDPIGGDEGAAYYEPPAAAAPVTVHVPGLPMGAQPNAPLLNPTQAKPPQPNAPKPPSPVQAQETAGKSVAAPLEKDVAFVGLSLANDSQIIALQDRLKAIYGANSDVEWQTPDTLHVTLVYCNEATDDHLAGIGRTIHSAPIAIHADSLGIFENGASRALYLEVTPSPDLKRLQKSIYQQFQQRKLDISDFSKPGQFKPHITLAYLGNDELKAPDIPVNVHTESDNITFGRDDYDTALSVPLKPEYAKSVRYVTSKQADAEAERDAWRRKATKGNALKAFVVEHLPRHVETFIREELEAVGAGASKTLVNAVFDDAAYAMGDWNAVKDYGNIADSFSDEIASLIGDANNDDASRAQFAGGMRSALRRHGLQAYRAGMNAGGADPESLSADDLATFRDWQNQQSAYVTGIGGQLYKDGQTPDPDDRSGMWQRKSLNSIYFEGLHKAAPDKSVTWNLGATEDHCGNCSDNDGQTKTVDEWKAQGFPQSDQLECKGFKCDCGFTDADGNPLGIGGGSTQKSVKVAEADKKYTQAEADYTDHASDPTHTCALCVHYLSGDSCTLVSGTIVSNGSCRYWEAKADDS